LWLLKRGYERWDLVQGDEVRSPPLQRPPLLLALCLLALSFTTALLSVTVMLQLVTGFTWREVILLIRGQYF
jgi:hypothetical protein